MPVEARMRLSLEGRMARPIVPRYLRRCTLCSRHAPGDERHFMLECPQFDDTRAQYFEIEIRRKDILSDESLQQGRNRSRELNFSP